MDSNANVRQKQEECRGFDYAVLHHCQYGVLVYSRNDIFDCGEPATHKVWWADGDAMYVCLDHFKAIIKAEREAVRAAG